MSNDPTLPGGARATSGKTYRVSLWVIAALAFVQIAAIAFAVVRNDLGSRELADRRPVDPQFTFASSTSVPAGFPQRDELFNAQGWEPVAEPPVIEPTTRPSAITDPLVLDKLEFARERRKEGDVQTALEHFLDANKQLPDSPEILYEIASCYTALDLLDQASDAWMELRLLGPERGGEFYQLAELALLGSRDDAASPRKLLSFSNHHLSKNPLETSGEMLTLRVAIKAQAGAEIDHDAVQLRVLFFDLINGRTIARGLHDGDYPRKVWTEPVDWKDNPREEIIDFAYYRAYADEVPGEGRQFYGFVAQLFYDNEWQDIVAQPRTLVEEMRSSQELAPPQPGGGARIDTSLFPQP